MILAALAAPMLAQATPQVSANDLVREAASLEVKNTSARQERFRYRIHRVTPDRDETKLYVETDMGTIARLIAQGDKPLAPAVQAREDARLQNLLAHPELQRERQRRQQQDAGRITRMVAALPDAFLYEYDGSEPGKSGETIRLRFAPNPKFDPSSRELKVYEGMKGTLWIDAGTHHIVHLQAELFRDVDFGWGILGRLYKGGHFDIEQSDLGGGRWETTYMNLDFTGRVLLFKSLRIRDTQTLSDVHRIADSLSLEQGIALLRSYDPEKNVVAQESPAPPTRSPKH